LIQDAHRCHEVRIDFGTLLGLAWAVLPLAIVGLVLWPILVAVIESFKVIRGSVRQSTFVITDTGATIWQKDSRNSTTESISVGDQRLRLSVLFACGMEAAFIVFLTVFLFQHADPRGDGMEMAGVGFAFMLIFLPFTLPAFILARNGRWLVLAATLAALAAFAYFGLWLELVNDLGLPKS
jgi:ABC-type sugar transport system permease subunit